MNRPLNIHDTGQIIELTTGIYAVRVLGGWGVKVGGFTFELKDLKSGDTILPKKIKWGIQSYALKKRAKKVFSIDVAESGKYSIEFKNQQDLKVRKSNLVFSNVFAKPVPNKKLEICIG